MSKTKGLSRKEAIAHAKECGFFKKKGIKVMYIRENGHSYYTQPPKFVDGLDTYIIKRKDLEVESNSGKETPKKEESKK